MMVPVIKISYEILQALTLIVLLLPVIYLFFFALSGKFYRQPSYSKSSINRRIAILLPSYKEDAVIRESAANALLQSYPPDCYDVIVIADSLQQETLDELRDMPLKVIEVKFEKSTKAKALNKAMEMLGDSYDIAVILDADNHMEGDFLQKINSAFESGMIAVQGHRTAGNQQNSLALLDGISEEINNHIFRKGPVAAGFSSALIGSGMAFNFKFFRELMSGVDAVGGFDKDIELKMLSRWIRIGYLDNAIVYDEKVSRPEVFTSQRRRWLSAQFHYLGRDFLKALRSLFRDGNLDYFDKVVQFMLPPRILLFAAVILAGTFFLTLDIIAGSSPAWILLWCILMILCAGIFILSVPVSFYQRRTIKAITGIPHGAMLMMGSLLNTRGANREFLHTEHNRKS